MQTIDAVLFDLDGTLLNTLPDIHAAVNAALEAARCPLRTMAQTRAAIGDGSRKLIERSLPAGADEAAVDETLRLYRAAYNAHLTDRTVPYPGIGELLAELARRGLRLGVVTNKFHDNARAMMDKYFPGLIAVTEGNRADRPTKPAPDAVNAALEALGAAPERTLYVGDSGVDYDTARNAGLRCVLVSWGYWDRERLEKLSPPRIADAPEELLNIIDTME